jgi:predicted metal-dependent peptidase
MDSGKLLRAKMGLILEQPFYATLMMSKIFVEDESIKTSDINGKTIRYNPEYFDSLPPDELKGVICHLVMHTAMLHHTRREGRDKEQWNKACDYAINPLITQSGMVLPKDSLNSSQYSDLAAENIYTMLGNKPKQDAPPAGVEGDGEQPGEGEGDNSEGCGNVSDAVPEYEIAQQEQQAKQEFAQAVQMAKRQGNLPAGFERLIEQILEPNISWKEKLARFLSEVAKNDYTFTKPNLRYLSTGFILPGLYNEEMGEIVLVVDTSGSINEEELNVFAGEMQDICSSFKAKITVLFVDTKVCHTQVIEPDEDFQLEPKGGGGTDFRPGFEYLEQEQIEPKCLVYFTDGVCHSFPEEPAYPVMWAQSGGYKMDVPFGEIININ